jgi:hypothetical protein
MITDYMTKPLIGVKFEHFRKLIMNLSNAAITSKDWPSGVCWAIYVITNFITNKTSYHNYRSEKILIISDIMTKRPKSVTRTIITTHE